MGLRTWAKKQVRRVQARYEAARANRLNGDFLRSSTSANAEVSTDLQVLWDSSRALGRDNPAAVGVKRSQVVNIIGASGIRLVPQVKNLAGTALDSKRNQKISDEYRLWSTRNNCDVAGRNSLLTFQWHIAAAKVDSGEVFFRIHRGIKFGTSKVPLALEMIESDQVDYTYNAISDRRDHRWVMGIELNKWNRATRYALLTSHPGDQGFRNNVPRQRHEFVSAADIIHVYGFEGRVNKLRPEPLLTPVILTAHNMREYQKSHLVKQRSKANQMGWIQTPDTLEGKIVDNKRTVESQAGIYRRLNPGEIPIPPDFGPEDTSYPSVIEDSLRTMAVGTNSSYNTVSGDFSEGSYATIRINVFENREGWKMDQISYADQFCQRVYEEFFYAAVMSGALPSPMFDDYWFRPERYSTPKWQPRNWPLLDQNKDLQALKTERELQLVSHGDQISNHSGDEFVQVMDEIADQNKIKFDKGLLTEIDDPKPKPVSPA